eukprot:scaffold3726_cov270-Pinguiococcus_pyrenoidosus.AAC.15
MEADLLGHGGVEHGAPDADDLLHDLRVGHALLVRDEVQAAAEGLEGNLVLAPQLDAGEDQVHIRLGQALGQQAAVVAQLVEVLAGQGRHDLLTLAQCSEGHEHVLQLAFHVHGEAATAPVTHAGKVERSKIAKSAMRGAEQAAWRRCKLARPFPGTFAVEGEKS